MRYFVYTGDGMEFYHTREEAIRAAQEAIDEWRDCADPEWPEEVENVFWGVVHGKVVREPIENHHVNVHYVDYKLIDVDGE